MNLYNYLSTINRFWSNGDGGAIAKLISINGNHTTNANFHIEHPENAVERGLPQPIDEVVIYHLKVLFYLNCDRK